MKKLVFGFLLSIGLIAQAVELSTEQKVLEFNQLLGTIKSSYGPYEYKQSMMNIPLKSLEVQYLKAIEASKTNAEYYDLMIKFVAEFKDSHFSIRIPSKKKASLNFVTDLVGGKVLVETVNVTKLPADKFPMKRGDEIVSFDGRPTMEVVKDLMVRRGDGYHKSTERISTMYLANRNGGLFPMPKGNALIEVKSRETGTVTKLEIPWEITGTDFETAGRNRIAKKFSFDNLFMTPLVEATYMCNGGSRIKRPEKAVVVTEKPFISYYYPTDKGNIGYLRIPHYVPQMLPGIQTEDAAFEIYEYAVRELEKNTVGLIIDQDHNCGGSVSYLHRLVSLFASQPTEEMQFRLGASKEMIILVSRMMEQMNPNTIAYKEAESLLALLKKSHEAGDFLTPKTTLTLKQHIYPNSVRYTKPILMLIDELSGSGGDAFPAILQGIGRATLLGTRTMGAGGHVTPMTPLYFSRLEINMTRSLFYRPDGVPVENHGATPNIPYSITENDFVNEYVEYREFYTKKLLELL